MLVPVLVDWPVSPANIPVPPVITAWIVSVEVFVPVTVPLSVKVPNRVPQANTFVNVPLAVNIVRLVKVVVPAFAAMK